MAAFGTGPFGFNNATPDAYNAAQASKTNAMMQDPYSNSAMGGNFDNYAASQRSKQGAEQNIAAIGAAPALLSAQNQQSRFNTVFPWEQQQFGALSKQLGDVGAQGGAAGQAPAGQPKIDAAPVWTPSQVQQQVNSQVAGNDAQTGTNIRQNAQGLAGRGFGGRSPLLSELTAQAQGQGMQANNQVRQAVPFQAAQGNAQQLLAGQQAQQSQFQSGQENQIQRKQIAAQQQSALLSALSNLAH